ncbi:MAG TPA: ABC transporter ATP-binding protein [Streptosporangiaceae bacterium]|jgi:ATP-binding cassette subfamily B protein
MTGPAGKGGGPPARRGGPGFGPGFGGPGGKPLNFRASGVRLLRLLAAQRPLVAGVAGLGAAGVALSVLGPPILGHATDLIFSGAVGTILGRRFPAGTTKQQAVTILRQHGQRRVADLIQPLHVTPGQGIDFTAVGRVLAVVLIVFLAASVLLWLQGRLATLAVQRATFRLRADVSSKLSRLPLRHFDRQPRGEILSRVTNDIDNVAQTLQQTLSQLITSVFTVIGVLIAMLLISPLLAAVTVVTVPVCMLAAARIGHRAQPQFIAQWSTTGQLNSHVEEVFTGHTLVTMFGRQAAAMDTFTAHNDRLCRASARAQFVAGLIQPVMTFIGNLNYVFLAVIGGLRVASGQLSIGDVQAFIQYTRQFSQASGQFASMAGLLQSGVASAERIFELLDAPEQGPEPARPARPRAAAGRIRFEEVTFRYDGEVPLIEGLSLAAEPGQTVAIVGPTGAGKTTLVNLLLRFYDVTGGRITLGGVDIATMSRADLRSSIGLVLQDTWLFGDTIAANIGYGADHPSRERVIEAAVAAHADHFIRTLPDGYDTVVDEDGSNLSAGERQLITIARAILSGPEVLVLDEATSAVDGRTELLVQQGMSELRRGRTSLVIAHRLSTIREADVIVVMDEGRIAEQGSHDDLLAAGGAYARLYAAQFQLTADHPDAAVSQTAGAISSRG